MTKTFYLDEADHKKVSDAVAAAESHSAGEIVTIVADRSDSYADVAMAWASFAAFTALAVFATFPDHFLAAYDNLTGGWTQEWTITGIATLALVFAALKFFAVLALLRWQALKFLLIPPQIKTARAHERAVSFFKVGAERRTHGRTGILIYLSMREHRAEIVADQAIADKVDAQIWGQAMASMLAEIKQGHPADGMAIAVKQVGAVLAQHFPRDQHDLNELPDRLIEL